MQPIFPGPGQPFLRCFFVLTISFAGFLLTGPAVAALICSTFYPGDLLITLSQTPLNPNARLPLMIVQACSAGIGLIVTPLLFLKFIEKKSICVFLVKKKPSLLFLTPAIAILFLFPLSIIINWNENIHFPQWMSGFAQWATQAEAKAHELTLFLTHFDTPPDFAIGLLVIAVLPAIGEELLFRGFVQNYLWKAFANPHLAIWMTAFLFSAIHLQFFGFFPRMFLGALFGYLYFWSGSLWVPMAAHFFNNALNVILIYLRQLTLIDFDADHTPDFPFLVIITTLAALVFLLFRFKKSAVE